MMRYTILCLALMLVVSCAVSASVTMPTKMTPAARPPTDPPTITRVAMPTLTNIPPTRALADTPTVAGIVTLTKTPTPAETAAPVSNFFPMGFMMVRQEHLGQIPATGLKVVHAFAGSWDIAEAEEYLNQAEAARLLVIGDLLGCRAYETGHPSCEGVSLWSEQEWSEYILTLSTHDNLIVWYLPDEIDDYAVAAGLYEWVQKYDPRQRPVYDGNSGTFDFETIQRFPAFSDFLWGAGILNIMKRPGQL